MTYWLETLQGWDKIKVIIWSSFALKRYRIFEAQLSFGKHARAACKDVDRMSYSEIRVLYKEYKKNKK
jgi:hypothetical protein